MFNNRSACTLGVCSVFILVLLAVVLHGRNSRVYAPQAPVFTVDSPEKTLALWKEKKLKGRILLLFDNYPHLRGRYTYYSGSYRPTSTNFIELALFENIIREIYYIVPDYMWEQFRTNEMVHPLRAVPGLERGLFLYSINGLTIIATTPTSLPQLPEQVLVYVNGSMYKVKDARDLLAQKNITSDIFVTYQGPR